MCSSCDSYGYEYYSGSFERNPSLDGSFARRRWALSSPSSSSDPSSSSYTTSSSDPSSSSHSSRSSDSSFSSGWSSDSDSERYGNESTLSSLNLEFHRKSRRLGDKARSERGRRDGTSSKKVKCGKRSRRLYEKRRSSGDAKSGRKWPASNRKIAISVNRHDDKKIRVMESKRGFKTKFRSSSLNSARSAVFVTANEISASLRGNKALRDKVRVCRDLIRRHPIIAENYPETVAHILGYSRAARGL